jgi:hypothetical protein
LPFWLGKIRELLDHLAAAPGECRIELEPIRLLREFEAHPQHMSQEIHAPMIAEEMLTTCW